MTFDARRAHLTGPDMFKRFRAPEGGESLAALELAPDRPLLLFEREGDARALDATQMTYHHVAQGTLREKPYLVTF